LDPIEQTYVPRESASGKNTETMHRVVWNISNCALWMTLRKDGFRPDGHIEIKGNHPENSGCQDVDGMNVNLEIVKQGLAEVYRGRV